MSRFLADTNVLIAIATAAHAQHEAAILALQAHPRAGDPLVLSAHTLVEVYSVLTRQPPPDRHSPESAGRVVESFADGAELVVIAPENYVAFLQRQARAGVAGGQIYDAVIAEAARIGGADTVLTFNRRHFEALADSFTVEVPSL